MGFLKLLMNKTKLGEIRIQPLIFLRGVLKGRQTLGKLIKHNRRPNLYRFGSCIRPSRWQADTSYFSRFHLFQEPCIHSSEVSSFYTVKQKKKMRRGKVILRRSNAFEKQNSGLKWVAITNDCLSGTSPFTTALHFFVDIELRGLIPVLKGKCTEPLVCGE